MGTTARSQRTALAVAVSNRRGQAPPATSDFGNALSQQLYAQGQPQPEAPGGPSVPPSDGDGDVIDGEVRDA